MLNLFWKKVFKFCIFKIHLSVFRQFFHAIQNVMNTKVLLAALAGTVTSFLTGWVIYGMLLKGYFDGQVMEGARSVMRAEPTMWAIALGCLAWALLLALIYSRWAGISTFKSGAIAGAWVTGLVAAGADFYSTCCGGGFWRWESPFSDWFR
jgi:hypothetical protein